MSGSTLPTVMTSQGLQPQTPAALNAQLLANAQALAPGLTVLPGGLISDLSGTGTGALLVMDSARIDVINSVSPLGANPFLLYQLGSIYGVPQGQGSNGSVFVVFTGSAAGIRIAIGFTVSDGANSYVIQDGGVTGTSLQTPPLFAVATSSASFPIPPDTVNQLVTSAPTGFTLTVTNPLAGTPAQSAQTISSYRSQVLQAGVVVSAGTTAYLRTLLGNVAGVNPNLISIPIVGSNYKVIVGGSGDPFQIAGAIFQSGLTISLLVGSTLGVANFTEATNGVVTTTINHGYATGQAVVIAGVVPSAYNGSYSSITVLSENTFAVNVNTSTFGAYSSGGVITPNFRNQSIVIIDFPDSYTIPFVIPPSQAVTMAVSWNTISSSFVSASAVAQLSAAALSAYINSLSIGQPINVDVMIATFQTSVAAILPAQFISTITFSVDINGVATSPESGTVLIFGDPESFFTTTSAAITVTQA